MTIDTHFDKVDLLLPMNGADNGTVFTDYSATPKIITRYGDTKTKTDQSKYYGSSVYFDGTSDSLYYETSLTTDFTVEMWIKPSYPSAATYQTLWFIQGTGLYLYNGTIILYTAGGSRTWSPTIPVSGWIHIALTRLNENFNIWCDGIKSQVTYADSTIYAATNHFIGNNSAYTEAYAGYLQDIRITKGVARYTENFTPPTSLFGKISGQTETSTDTIHLFNNKTGVATVVQSNPSFNFNLLTHDQYHLICTDSDGCSRHIRNVVPVSYASDT